METTEILKKYCKQKYGSEIVIKTYSIQEIKQIIDFTKQLLLSDVVVPKGTYCDRCGQEIETGGTCAECEMELRENLQSNMHYNGQYKCNYVYPDK